MKSKLLFFILLALMLVGCDNPGTKHTKSGAVWEHVCNGPYAMDNIYRTRIYGGWLVTRGSDSIIFIPLNHPDEWKLNVPIK